MIIRRILLSASVIAAMMLGQAASADDRSHRRGYNSYGSSFNYGSGYSSGRINPYHYGNSGRYRDSYFSVSIGNRYNRYPRYGRHDSGSFLGGLVLGSLLSYPRTYQRPIYRPIPVADTYRTNGGDVRVYSSAPVTTGRRLLRDLEGNCFERNSDEEGNEIRVQLDPSECDF